MNRTLRPAILKRQIGLLGAITIGLGSIIGTGIFVSIGVAAGASCSSVISAVTLAAIVAIFNALSSAQLAVAHPLSGGSYEYGYRYLHPWLGFTAGWMFLCAKTASAAAAALGFAGYFIHLFHIEGIPIISIAVCTVFTLTILVLSGLRWTHWTNVIVVSITLVTLTLFVLFGLPSLVRYGASNLNPLFPKSSNELNGFLYATALMFVAYTGYGRIATLSEEVINPRKFIPNAIVVTLIVSAVLYIAVSLVAVGSIGANSLAQATQSQTTPLETAALAIGTPGLGVIVAIGACTAMIGVLLNLILGLSRVVLAMSRRGDLPPLFAQISPKSTTPSAAIIGIGISIISLIFIGNLEITWAFSAFTILIYYAITNLAALYLPKNDRLYPRFVALGGLFTCFFLAFWVPTSIWIAGILMIMVGFIWYYFAHK